MPAGLACGYQKHVEQKTMVKPVDVAMAGGRPALRVDWIAAWIAPGVQRNHHGWLARH